MRRREISPEFWTDERVIEVTDGAKLLFIGLWALADREGRLEDRPKTIALKVRPWDPAPVPGFLDELIKQGMVVRYEADGASILQIPRFSDHQHVHPKEMASKLPPPKPSDFVDAVKRLEVSGSAVEGTKILSLSSGSSFPSGSSGSSSLTTYVEQAPLLPIEPPKAKPPKVRPMAIKTDDMTDDEWAVFDHWRVSTGKLNAMLDPKRLALIRRWLATPGITVQRLQRAIDGCCKTPWNRGENPNRKKYLDLELILRDAAQFEKFEAAA